MKKIKSKGRIVDMGKNLPAPAPRVFEGKLAGLEIDGVRLDAFDFSYDADLVPGMTNKQARAEPCLKPVLMNDGRERPCLRPMGHQMSDCSPFTAFERARMRDVVARAGLPKTAAALFEPSTVNVGSDPRASLQWGDEADSWDELLRRAHQRLVDTLALKREGEAPLVKIELLHSDGRWRHVHPLVGADITGHTPDEKAVELRFDAMRGILTSATTAHLDTLHVKNEEVWLRFAGSAVYRGRVVETFKRAAQNFGEEILVFRARVRLERTEGPPVPKNGVKHMHRWKRHGRQEEVQLDAGDDEVTT